MYTQSFLSSSYSTSSNSNTPPTPSTMDPMYQNIPQPFDHGYSNPTQQLDMGMMGYHQPNNMMMMMQPFGRNVMIPANNETDYYGHQLQDLNQQYPLDYQMMPQQMMVPETLQNYQGGFQQDVFQPIPELMPNGQHDFGYLDNTQESGTPDFHNGIENLPPIPVDNYSFINSQPSAPRRKSTKKKVPKVSTMHLNTSCSNCGTRETKLWRRNEMGEAECNPCNLYHRTTGVKRPESLWNKPTIKRKRRAPAAPVVQNLKNE